MQYDVKLTESLEDYLKSIYIISKSGGEVRITDIALFMNLSKPSVNKAVANLKANGLLDHEKYGGIRLTKLGGMIAREIYFRHKTLTDFLVKTLNIDPTEAETEACKMEHVISPQTLTKLVEYMKSCNEFI